MAFSRENISSTSQFTREGQILETVSYPLARIWDATSDVRLSQWDLGKSWTLESSAKSLVFKFQSNAIMTITNEGLEGMDFTDIPQLDLSNNLVIPNTNGPLGNIAKVNNILYVLTSGLGSTENTESEE